MNLKKTDLNAEINSFENAYDQEMTEDEYQKYQITTVTNTFNFYSHLKNGFKNI